MWSHRTDAKARPGVSFMASVNVGTNSYFANNSYDINQILQNQYSSNISFSKNWQNKPFSLNIGITQNQNSQSHEVDMKLPVINFYISQFNPFQNKNAIRSRWFDKITMSYTMNAENAFRFYDTGSSFRDLSFDKFNNGITHKIPISASYNVLRFINLSLSANYNEYWLTHRQYRYFNTNEYSLDTISSRGFFTGRDFSASFWRN